MLLLQHSYDLTEFPDEIEQHLLLKQHSRHADLKRAAMRGVSTPAAMFRGGNSTGRIYHTVPLQGQAERRKLKCFFFFFFFWAKKCVLQRAWGKWKERMLHAGQDIKGAMRKVGGFRGEAGQDLE